MVDNKGNMSISLIVLFKCSSYAFFESLVISWRARDHA